MHEVVLNNASHIATQRRRFTTDEYHRLGEAGILRPDERVELIEGEIIRMNPVGGPHVMVQSRLLRDLTLAIRFAGDVIGQNPLILSDASEPEPDIAVLRTRADPKDRSKRRAVEALLVVEVSDTTYDYDKHIKAPRYAASGIPEAWVINVVTNTIEVFTNPSTDGYLEIHQHPIDKPLPLRFLSGQHVDPSSFLA